MLKKELAKKTNKSIGHGKMPYVGLLILLWDGPFIENAGTSLDSDVIAYK